MEKLKRHFTQSFCVVGGLIEKNGKFLLVREANSIGPDAGKWNQPAGWLDVGEDPIEAAAREVTEETGYNFKPTHILGIYSLVRNDLHSALGATPHAVKLIFIGDTDFDNQAKLEEDVVETKWFTADEIFQMKIDELRDEDIKELVKDFIDGKKYPLEIIRHHLQKN